MLHPLSWPVGKALRSVFFLVFPLAIVLCGVAGIALNFVITQAMQSLFNLVTMPRQNMTFIGILVSRRGRWCVGVGVCRCVKFIKRTLSNL